MEELFGEIEDEHDTDEYIAKQTEDDTYLLSARLEIERQGVECLPPCDRMECRRVGRAA